MLTYPWKCTVLHCNHLGNTWKPLVLMTRHFDYCPSASKGDKQSVRSSAPVVSRCFPGGYNVKLYISRGRLAWWLLAFLHSGNQCSSVVVYDKTWENWVMLSLHGQLHVALDIWPWCWLRVLKLTRQIWTPSVNISAEYPALLDHDSVNNPAIFLMHLWLPSYYKLHQYIWGYYIYMNGRFYMI